MTAAVTPEPTADEPRPAERATATVYAICGSHACRTATLMLEHKRIPYRLVVFPSGIHPLLVRACGFAGNRKPIRSLDGANPPQLVLLDRLGTVPALRLGEDRVQTNHEIARFLERKQPMPALFPADGAHRRAVEEAESWGDETLQMAARRVALAAKLDSLSMRGADGRLGPLLAKSAWMRALLARNAGALFRANAGNEAQLLSQVPAMLDRVDAWMQEGVIGSEKLNAADFTIAPSVALLSYHNALRQQIAARPAGALIDRLLPEPRAGALR